MLVGFLPFECNVVFESKATSSHPHRSATQFCRPQSNGGRCPLDLQDREHSVHLPRIIPQLVRLVHLGHCVSKMLSGVVHEIRATRQTSDSLSNLFIPGNVLPTVDLIDKLRFAATNFLVRRIIRDNPHIRSPGCLYRGLDDTLDRVDLSKVTIPTTLPQALNHL